MPILIGQVNCIDRNITQNISRHISGRQKVQHNDSHKYVKNTSMFIQNDSVFLAVLHTYNQ